MSESKSQVVVRPILNAVEAWDNSSLGSYLPGVVQLSILHVSVPPSGSSDWHTNPTPVAVYVMAGSLNIEVEGTDIKKVVKAGNAFAEIRDLVNRHGTAGPEGAELIVFFAGSPGVSLMGPPV